MEIGVNSRALNVVNHELDIWWNPVWLYGAEIDAQYSCALELVRHCHIGRVS